MGAPGWVRMIGQVLMIHLVGGCAWVCRSKDGYGWVSVGKIGQGERLGNS